MSKEQLKKKSELLGRVVKIKKGNHKPDAKKIFGKWIIDDFIMTRPDKQAPIKAYGFCTGCGLPARLDERNIVHLQNLLTFEYSEERFVDKKTYFEYDECAACGLDYKNVRIATIK